MVKSRVTHVIFSELELVIPHFYDHDQKLQTDEFRKLPNIKGRDLCKKLHLWYLTWSYLRLRANAYYFILQYLKNVMKAFFLSFLVTIRKPQKNCFQGVKKEAFKINFWGNAKQREKELELRYFHQRNWNQCSFSESPTPPPHITTENQGCFTTL